MPSPGQHNYGVWNGGFNNIGYDPTSFSFNFDFVYPSEVITLTHIIEHEDGSEQRLKLTPVPVRSFVGQELGISDARKFEIEQFLDSKGNSLNTFSFTDPVDSNTYTVRSKENKVSWNKRRDGRWDVELVMLEVK
jgi:hypothetical protein